MPRLNPVHYRKLAKVFERQGFIYSRTEGDHLIYTKAGVLRPIVIPKYKEIPAFIVLKNLKTAGLSRKEYLKLLQTV